MNEVLKMSFKDTEPFLVEKKTPEWKTIISHQISINITTVTEKEKYNTNK